MQLGALAAKYFSTSLIALHMRLNLSLVHMLRNPILNEPFAQLQDVQVFPSVFFQIAFGQWIRDFLDTELWP